MSQSAGSRPCGAESEDSNADNVGRNEKGGPFIQADCQNRTK